jgi:hypothetical protein
MKLREHPLMNYRGLPNWPPAWLLRPGGGRQKFLRGEIGVLAHVIYGGAQPRSRIYLIIEHEGEEYIGALLFSDPTYCGQIADFLRDHRGYTIEEIGGLDVGQFD